jgi:integrase
MNINTPPPPRYRRPRRAGKLSHPKSSTGYICADWYTRVYLLGQAYWLNLGLSRHTAIELDREARRRLRAGESLLSVKAHIAKCLQRTPSDLPPSAATGCATVGDAITVHQGAYFKANDRTTRTYRRGFLNLVETVVRHRHRLPPLDRAGRKVTVADYTEILDLPLSILDDVFVADFRACRMTGCPRGTPAEISAQASTNSELRFAQSMFTDEAMIAYRGAKLVLPDLSGFRRAKAFPRVRLSRVPPPSALITNLHAAVGQLAVDGDEALFLVVALALFAGLRRKEILHSHADWLQTKCGPAVVVSIGRDFMPKSRREREVSVPAWLYARLGTRPADYFAGQTPAERNAAYNRALRWLRAHGLANVPKPLHYLRALYAGFLLSRFNIFKVKSRLGHEDITTTLRYYAENPYSDVIAALWDVVLPAHPAAPAIVAPAIVAPAILVPAIAVPQGDSADLAPLNAA